MIELESSNKGVNFSMSSIIRGYRARAPEPAAIEPTPPPAAPTWPKTRYYRAYCQEDDDAVAAIMAKYGLSTKDDAIRLALRLAAGDAIQIKTNAPAAKRVVIKIRARQL